MSTIITPLDPIPHLTSLPDNQRGVIAELQAVNTFYRSHLWPRDLRTATHRLHLGDARNLSWIPDKSVHLIVTSPPYWTLKRYAPHTAQLGALEDYEEFLTALDSCWKECERVLAPGGRLCCVVGDVCIPRKRAGRHYLVPL